MLVDKIGVYEARNGLKVVIHTAESDSKYTFSVKGHYFTKSEKTGKDVPNYSIWKPNGQYRAVGESKLDIVKKISL